MLANLEGPILPADHTLKPVAKAGPNIFSTQLPPEDGCFTFALANNHSMDYGTPGLKATLGFLDQRGFKSCGVGNSITEARRPLIVEDCGTRVGILACCEAQFGVARDVQAGTAEFGPWVYRTIADLRQEVDVVVVSVHAAVEDSPWPSPYIQELYRSYMDAGATVVHGHHAHVPQGWEEYGDGVIFYGMGNYAVDPSKWQDYPNGTWSLGAQIDFSTRPLRWQLLTFEIRHEPDTDLISIEASTDEELADHRTYLEKCTRPLDELELLGRLWQEVALRGFYRYGAAYMRFSSPSDSGRVSKAKESLSILRSVLLSGPASAFHSKQQDFALWYNMIACESHRQMLSTALGILGGEIKDLRTDETRQLADEVMPWSIGADGR
jgi:poly-gamma-glutamate synthesis protein (capsule biosynthesis protein)